MPKPKKSQKKSSTKTTKTAKKTTKTSKSTKTLKTTKTVKTTRTRRVGAGTRKKPIEQYDHKGKDRLNNPPVGLVDEHTDKDGGKKTYAYEPHIDPALQFDHKRSQIENIIDNGLAAEELDQAKEALAELKKCQEPYLNWAGKAERTSFEVPTVSLHVHERIDPRTIIEAVRKKNGQNYEQMSLFHSPEENPPIREAIEFYKHRHNWSNRLIAGDSLLVMNSLIEKEGLAGQVQMVYIDPPYGIKYGSNFQPFINKREVKEGKDEDLTQEPEMIKAFRDTWELGIHSYLGYLRDRLWIAKDLLPESGSIFVQIGEENIHRVRNLMDEVFGEQNFVSQLSVFKTTTPRQLMDNNLFYLLWYAKDIKRIKYRQPFIPKSLKEWTSETKGGSWGVTINGKDRPLTPEEKADPTILPPGSQVYQLTDLFSAGAAKDEVQFEFNNEIYVPRTNTHWKTTLTGLENLASSDRIEVRGGRPWFKRYHSDWPMRRLTNVWSDTSGKASQRIYVVQTQDKVIERCILMTTDPGDLVLDPTCGSGTTAFISESWGRRWITCDTSRVAVTLAKQRLLTALFDYYKLAQPGEGVGSGFIYKMIPHITLKSIAYNEPPNEESLYDQPIPDNKKARVSGPLTVEAVPAPMVKPLAEVTADLASDESVARTGETVRQAEWRDELFKTGIRGKGGQKIEFTRIEPLPGTRYLHADGETKSDKPERVAISFGPDHAPLEQRQVSLAIEEAQKLVPKPKILIFASFQFDPEASKDIDETDWPGVTLLKAQMNTDLLTEDLKKKRSSNESFWLIGQPDILIHEIREKGKPTQFQVDLQGFDYYNTKTGAVESGGTEKIAMWMLDTDYDGRSLFPRQVFFPMAGENEGWAKLAKNLKAEIDEELIEQYRGTTSLAFEPGENKRVAVKIIDDRGIESLVIAEL